MKALFNSSVVVLLFNVAMVCHGQQAVTIPPPTPYKVISRDANSQVWERTVYESGPLGRIISRKHAYTELATGLNFKDLATGQWVPSKEEINILPDGTAAAVNGQHKAYFPGDIYGGVIKLVTPDGQKLQSRPAGLSYDDGTNTVLIAELTNSVGQLISSNQVIYTNAFVGVDADLLYTYRKGGFEQDLIFREQPPTPEQFGLSSDNARLQLLTEFFNPPSPSKIAGPINARDRLRDNRLTFGRMQMIPGKAFLAGDNHNNSGKDVPVYKSWVAADGRTFLIEEVPYRRLNLQFETLPQPAASTISSANPILRKVTSKRLLPPKHLVEATTNTVQLAKADFNTKNGLVFDYITINSDITNYTFQGDTTYYISGSVGISGNAIFEGGTVIKYSDSGGCLHFVFDFPYTSGSMPICEGGPYRPIILTSMDDNTVGDTISGSSGNPTTNEDTYIWIDYNPITTPPPLSDIRASYAGCAVEDDFGGDGFDVQYVSDSQFINCYFALNYNYGRQILENDLFSNCRCVMNQQQGGDLQLINVTADKSSYLINDGNFNEGANVELTNSILLSVTNMIGMIAFPTYPYTYNVPTILQNSLIAGIISSNADITSDSSYEIPGPTNLFQRIGAANYYLTNGSAFRGEGTANIDPTLLEDLSQKTTWPPLVWSNITILTNLILNQQVPRETNSSLDLGYHYDALDYLFGGVHVTNANVTVNSGTAIGAFELDTFNLGTPYSIDVEGVGYVNCQGLANKPNHFVQYNTVQEGPSGANWASDSLPPYIITDFVQYAPTNAIFNFRFTDFSVLGGSVCPWVFARSVYGDTSSSPVYFRDCEIYGGFGYSESANITNCLFDRVQADFEPPASAFSSAYNNLIYGGSFDLDSPNNGTINASVKNNLFALQAGDTVLPTWETSASGYNAYYWPPGTSLPFPNDFILTNAPVFQDGPLGNFYQAPGSLTIHAGSTTANLLGLYHYTVTTDQAIEGTSTVSIGYHYVAVDQYGNPLDSNADGIPDYLEDANGDGVYDTGDLRDWQNTLYLNVIISQPHNGSVLP